MAKPVPAINEPFVGLDGRITDVWYKYLLSLMSNNGNDPAQTTAGIPVFGEFTTNRIDSSINGAYEKNGQEFFANDFTGENNPYQMLLDGKAQSIDLNTPVYNMIDIVGSPTIEDFVISGFSTANYGEIRIPQAKESFEIIIKFNPSNLSSQQVLFDRSYNQLKKDYGGLILRLNTNGTIKCWATSTGASWNIFNNYDFPGLTFTANTDQYLKFEYKNGVYYLARSLDNENWTYSTGSISNPRMILFGLQSIGVNHYDNNYPYSGSIDLKGFKIVLDDKVYWQYKYNNEYERQVSLTGGCSKFGLDTINKKFKLPTEKCREITSEHIIGNTEITLYNDGYVEQKIKYCPTNQNNLDSTGYMTPVINLPIEMADRDYEVRVINDRNSAFGDSYNNQLCGKTTKGFVLGYVVSNGIYVIITVKGYSKDFHNVQRKMIQLSNEVSEPKTIEHYEERLEQKTDEEIEKINQTGIDGKVNLDLENMDPSNTSKDIIEGWRDINYSARIQIANNYTITKRGYVWGYNTDNNAYFDLYVNGIYLGGGNTNHNGRFSAYAEVSAGDVITMAGNGPVAFFAPVKGE